MILYIYIQSTFVILNLFQFIKISSTSLIRILLMQNYYIILIPAFFLTYFYFCNLSFLHPFFNYLKCLVVYLYIIFFRHFVSAFVFVWHLIIHQNYMIFSLISYTVLVYLKILIKTAIYYFRFFFQKIW